MMKIIFHQIISVHALLFIFLKMRKLNNDPTFNEQQPKLSFSGSQLTTGLYIKSTDKHQYFAL